MKSKLILLLIFLTTSLTTLIAQMGESFFRDTTKGIGKERFLKFKKGYSLDDIVRMYKNDVKISSDLFAIKRLAQIYDQSNYMSLSEKPTDFNDSLCVVWYKLALDKGDSSCIHPVARYYDRHKNYREAFKWYKKVYYHTPSKAVLILHEYYSLGMGVKKDKEAALKFLKEAEKLGEKDYGLAFSLTSAYDSGGYGLEKNKKKYEFWFKKLSKIDKDMANKALLGR